MHHSTIEGSLLVINEDKAGSSLVVPSSKGRPAFVTLRARRDAVLLVDGEGEEHVLEGANPVDYETACAVGAVIVKEMSMDSWDGGAEYAIELDVDLTVDAETSSGPRP